MSKKDHGNSHKNQKDHHLYAIHDRKHEDIFKYGISADPIEEDGLSDRIRKQLNLFNLIAGWARFFVEIILRKIPGRKSAEEIETKYIEEYRKKHGRKPAGNRK